MEIKLFWGSSGSGADPGVPPPPAPRYWQRIFEIDREILKIGNIVEIDHEF
jgi:hypothetical protein